eukprot:494802-Amphidinium_carterae.1
MVVAILCLWASGILVEPMALSESQASPSPRSPAQRAAMHVVAHSWPMPSGEAFQTVVEESFEKVEEVVLPSWPLFRDRLSVWRRLKNL